MSARSPSQLCLIPFVAQLADGALALSGPATAPSPRARSIHGAAPFSLPGIPDASCMPMSVSSPPPGCAPTSAISLTSWPEALPVRKSPPQTARERALRTITCSGNGCASSSKCDLFGARLRIHLTQELQASTGYSMHWTRRTTPAGRSWWVLTMPARTIAGEGFGLLLPTPRASDVTGYDPVREGRTNGLDLPAAIRAMIPTPMGGSRAERGGTPMDASQWARERMAGMLGTPRSLRGYDSEEHAPGAAPNPRKLVYAMLPTPTARDSRSDQASPETMAKNSRPLSETSGALGLVGTAASPVSQRRALLLGLVLWMMGETADFLRACATAPLQRSVTRSSGRSRT